MSADKLTFGVYQILHISPNLKVLCRSALLYSCTMSPLVPRILSHLNIKKSARKSSSDAQLLSMSWSITSFIRSARNVREVVSERINLYKEPSHISSARCLAKLLGAGPVAVADPRNSITKTQPLKVKDGQLLDPLGRPMVLKGINVDGAMKLPVKPFIPLYLGNSCSPDNIFFDGDNVSFVGRPFPLDEAEEHFRRIKSWGFNTIRYLVTWEALEHEGPGKYDEDFISYTIEILRILHSVGGLYLFFDCHQDVWSRFCGGSGAPMWTLYAAGLEPKRISVTGAAVLHSDSQFEEKARSELDCYPNMLWTSNYKRLALFTMFTLFFAGEAYFPELTINGKNIQRYLQEHHINALGHFWSAIVKQLPEMIKDGSIVGFESLNEPNQGLVGHLNLGRIPDCQHLRIGTTPTVFDCFKTGMGLPVSVDVYKIAISGPQKCGKQVIDPKGVRVWLSEKEMQRIDLHYGWTRKGWNPGECIYASAGIWSYGSSSSLDDLNSSSLEERLLCSSERCCLVKPEFFNEDQKVFKEIPPYVKANLGDSVDTNFFVNVCFVNYYIGLKNMVRNICPSAFVLIQPLVLVMPPLLKDDPRGIIDDKTIYCPHYYDGMSLMFKSWNYRFNVDTLGIMRDRYANPVLGLVLGETAIRNCIKKQFCEIAREGKEYLGDIPVLMSETGMPFDMNNKRAYQNGRFRSQTSAVDALAFALESSDMHHTYWCYTSINNHQWGDHWNNEDFSFWSRDDRDVAALCDVEQLNKVDLPSTRGSSVDSTDSLRSSQYELSPREVICDRLFYHKKRLLTSVFGEQADPDKCDFESETSTLYSDNLSANCSRLSRNVHWGKQHYKCCYASPDGVRAVGAVIRPYLMTTAGTKRHSSFIIKDAIFELSVTFDLEQYIRAQKMPTIIFLPKWHFPCVTYNDIDITSGSVEYDSENEQLHWYMDSVPATQDNKPVVHSIVIRRYKSFTAEDGLNICDN